MTSISLNSDASIQTKGTTFCWAFTSPKCASPTLDNPTFAYQKAATGVLKTKSGSITDPSSCAYKDSSATLKVFLGDKADDVNCFYSYTFYEKNSQDWELTAQGRLDNCAIPFTCTDVWVKASSLNLTVKPYGES